MGHERWRLRIVLGAKPRFEGVHDGGRCHFRVVAFSPMIRS